MIEPPAFSDREGAFSNNENEVAPVAKSTENLSSNSIENPPLHQPEILEEAKNFEEQSNRQSEPEAVLPPVLQEKQTSQIEVVKPISQEYIHKGAKISSLTHVALETFRELQRKLALHYQKMKKRTSN